MKRALVGMVAAAALVAAGCSSSDDASGGGQGKAGASTTKAPASSTTAPEPEPVEDQNPPSSINGLVVDGDTIWVASIDDDEVIRIDRESGAIVGRYDTEGAGPDDVAVAPDGSIWTTGFANGDVGRIADGTYEKVTTIKAGINPLEFGPDGMLYLGTVGADGQLFQIDPAHPEVVVSLGAGMPGINAFGILRDGTIVAPAGNLSAPGSAVAIEVHHPCNEATGCTTVTTVADDLPGVAAGATDAEGNPYVLANVTGEVIAVDVEAKTSKVVQTVKQGAPFDNLSFAPDGTAYLSSFTAPSITEVAPDGTERVISIGS